MTKMYCKNCYHLWNSKAKKPQCAMCKSRHVKPISKNIKPISDLKIFDIKDKRKMYCKNCYHSWNTKAKTPQCAMCKSRNVKPINEFEILDIMDKLIEYGEEIRKLKKVVQNL